MKNNKSKSPAKAIAIAYYRYSSHSQNEASIEQQREQALLYAEAHNMTIVEHYKDEAVSGTTTDKRDDFQRMLSEAKRIKPNYLILWKIDRLARDRITAAIVKEELRKVGCKIVYIAECIPETPEGIIMESLMEGMAEYYSKQLSINVLRGMNHNAAHCLYNGRKTLGYSVDKETKKYIIDEATAPVVVKIFTDFANGKRIVDIIDELDKSGIRTVLGKKFTTNSLRVILHNRIYIGEYHWGDHIIPGGTPRIISDSLFERAQKRFQMNKHVNKAKIAGDEPDYSLTGKLVCGKCGQTICGRSGTSKTGKIYYYYSCINHRRHKCSLKDISKDKIEAHVAWSIREFLNDTENLASLAVDVSEYMTRLYNNKDYIKSLEAQLKEVSTKINNLIKALESAKGSAPEVVINRINELNTQKEMIEASIQNERIKISLSHDDYSIKKYFEMYAHADYDDPETRQKLMEYFIDSIIVFEDRIAIKFWFSDDRTEIPLDTLTEIIKGDNNNHDPDKHKKAREFDIGAAKPARSNEVTPIIWTERLQFMGVLLLFLSSYNLICLLPLILSKTGRT